MELLLALDRLPPDADVEADHDRDRHEEGDQDGHDRHHRVSGDELKVKKVSVIPFIPISTTIQGDHGGQLLHFVDFIYEDPECCPTALQFLPNLLLPKQNWADCGKTEL